MKLFINLLLLFLYSSSAWSSPHLQINKSVVDLQPCEQGRILQDKSVQLKNTGDQPLQIKLQTTCDCLEIKAEKTVLNPRESTSLIIKLDTSEEEGRIKKTFYIISNDPDNKLLLISVHVQVSGTLKSPEQTAGSLPLPARKGLSFYFFYTTDCPQCLKIKKGLFSDIEKENDVILAPLELDILKKENFEFLLKIKKYFKTEDNKVPVIIYRDHYIAGFSEINQRFPGIVRKYKDKGHFILERHRFREKESPVTMPLFTVITAGLIDGINPCAFTTIIFLIAYLNYLKKTKRIIFLTGFFYTFSVFITYLLIGAGLLKGLTALPFFSRISFIINLVIACFTFYLALLSFKDYRAARQGRIKEMQLQLSSFFKNRIHENIRNYSKGSWIIISSILMGFAVSVFELACTGQIYLPTIIYLTHSSAVSGYFYLIIYNLLFIFPLAVIFYIFYQGATSEKIAQVLQKHLAMIKLLTGILFLFLGILLIISLW